MGIDLLFTESHGSRDRLFAGNVLVPVTEKGMPEPGHVKVLPLAQCVFHVKKT